MMGGYGYGGYGPMMGGGGWLGAIVMFVLWALFVAGVVVLVVWLVRTSGGHRHGPAMGPGAAPTHDEAIAIARRRLASGEITAEQFEEIRKTLDGS